MKVHFEQDASLQKDIDITVKAADFNDEVKKLLTHIEKFDEDIAKLIPIKTTEKIVIIKINDIILADVQKDSLTIYTVTASYVIQERLYRFMDKLPDKLFVQVSKHAIINLDYLLALEDNFAGTMTARLENELRTSVSRKYLSDLEKHLGL
ncbi:LytTR family transcriptional regulator [Ligilactobacillus sp. WILCCON 0076]|uniref:LytTR family transcriptional regulator n=1 Tax=Ligilactobacillus ubinensis TaxID=2876789 RepID=A0A9X2FHA0_9LACO|nr:LytTR family DNA-binding domain-containing protein [Ligilactobacillus ubinensis]MCP0886106.1 LytTR family transcriptional regulator [Ligilactobacillus ubinensis]